MSFSKKDIQDIISNLKILYPDAKGSLNFSTPFELLVAVMLSAQCTDERVNLVTKDLFKKYNEPEQFSKLPQNVLEKEISSCGLYKTKAKNLIACSKQIMQNFNGEVPSSMEDLLTLPGIGRKSANVIRLEAFNLVTGIAVDTHVKRISNLIGLSSSKTPEEIEQDLIEIIPNENLKDVNHLLIFHGRNICKARTPKCSICPISNYCNYFRNNKV